MTGRRRRAAGTTLSRAGRGAQYLRRGVWSVPPNGIGMHVPFHWPVRGCTMLCIIEWCIVYSTPHDSLFGTL